MNPECYLLDEPTAGLDNDAAERFLRYLKDYTDTYIIITHDREFLKNFMLSIAGHTALLLLGLIGGEVVSRVFKNGDVEIIRAAVRVDVVS